MEIGIVDTGIGTTLSMQNMIKRAGFASAVFSEPSSVPSYTHLILPGVGHFSEGASRLSSQGWIEPLRTHVSQNRKLLGVCLGMQLLGTGSEEGRGSGLGILDYTVRRLKARDNVRVPHMGWNTVKWIDGEDHPLEGERYYFVHSFAVPADHDSVVGISTHGVEFGSVVKKGNVIGAQFHPEKSHKFGMHFLADFLRG